MDNSINIKAILVYIKYLRIYKGISQKKMADLLYVDLRTYTRFERGENKTFDLHFLNDIARILDTDLITMLAPNHNVIDQNEQSENINNVHFSNKQHFESFEEDFIDQRAQIIQHYISLLTQKDILIKELYELIDKLKSERNEKYIH